MNNTIRGFSLIEMMIVIVIIAILSCGGIYGFQQWRQQQRLWQTTCQLSQYLQHLRRDANEYNRDHILLFSQHHDRWCLVSQDHTEMPREVSSHWQFIPRFKEVSLVEMTQGLGFYGRDEYRKAWAYPAKQRCGETEADYFSLGAYPNLLGHGK